MNILDRTKAPQSQPIQKLHYKHPVKSALTNGIDLYSIHSQEKDLVRIDLIFQSGEWEQEMPMQAHLTNQMLNEGSVQYTSAEIAEKLDFYGSFVFFNTQKHSSTISIYSLGKYVDQTLDIVQGLVFAPTFPQQEFATMLAQKHQHFLVDNEKVETLATKHFLQTIFGKNHPYSTFLEQAHFEQLSVTHLADYHKAQYNSTNCYIIVAGNIKDSVVSAINNYFGSQAWGNTIIQNKRTFTLASSIEHTFYQERKNAVQTAVRIGRKAINRTHPDFKKLQILNTALGGYFGSRLMANIREDKGYTYGIHSSLASLRESGYFLISTQVKKEVWKDAVREIYAEIERFRTEPMPEDELNVVKNFMAGQILKNFDGPFSQADTLKSLLDYGMNYDYYRDVLDAIKETTSAEILALAQKYLQKQKLYEICIG